MKTATYTHAEWMLIRQLWNAAADDGIIQAEEMLLIAQRSRPELHKAISMSEAFTALTGKDWHNALILRMLL